VTGPEPRGATNASPRALANPGPILLVVAIGAIAVIVAIGSILRRPAVPAVVSEDYSRVAARLLVPDVRGADAVAVARALNGQHPSIAVQLPVLDDAGYLLEGGAVRPMREKPGVVGIYRNQRMDLLVTHVYQGVVSELPGPPEVRDVDGRRFVIQRKANNILVFWQHGPLVMVVTSSLPFEQVIRLADAAARSVDAQK
jgi:hypothetical protein